ncbi:MAG: hypothetical protein GY941_23550 [Planctomycetes bacterium]|nr:hypothetical protein [Planctomycetota bacterium]
MDAITIVETYLKQHDYDGLFNVGDAFCFCHIDEGIACKCGGVCGPDCYAGHTISVRNGSLWKEGPRSGFKCKKHKQVNHGS